MPAPRTTWIAALWRSFLDSYDADQNAAASTPLAVVGACFAEMLGIGLVWGLHPFPAPWLPIALTALAGVTSYVAFRHRCRGTVGALATLLDAPLYSAGLVYVACQSEGGPSYVAAGLHAAMVLAVQAPTYALSGLFAVALAAPTVIQLLVFAPPATVHLSLIGTQLIALLISYQTGERREMLRAKARLEGALDAADRAVEGSMQAALASTLLSIGDLLHELRNAQTVVGLNLAYLQEQAKLRDDEREALEEAIEGQRAEAALVRETVRSLQERAQQGIVPFAIAEVLREARSFATRASVEVRCDDDDFPVLGNPEHLRVVLRNLVRNAEQAGASRVSVEAQPTPGGHAIGVAVGDDGEGIPEPLRARLLDLFAFTTKAGGSGLGLYLVKRHVELLGGTISVHVAQGGGAEFRMVFPRGERPAGQAGA